MADIESLVEEELSRDQSELSDGERHKPVTVYNGLKAVTPNTPRQTSSKEQLTDPNTQVRNTKSS